MQYNFLHLSPEVGQLDTCMSAFLMGPNLTRPVNGGLNFGLCCWKRTCFKTSPRFSVRPHQQSADGLDAWRCCVSDNRGKSLKLSWNTARWPELFFFVFFLKGSKLYCSSRIQMAVFDLWPDLSKGGQGMWALSLRAFFSWMASELKSMKLLTFNWTLSYLALRWHCLMSL